MLLFDERMRLDPHPHPVQLRHAILIDTSRMAIVIVSFVNHHQLMEEILSDDYRHLKLYRTQYELPSDEQIIQLSRQIFS